MVPGVVFGSTVPLNAEAELLVDVVRVTRISVYSIS